MAGKLTKRGNSTVFTLNRGPNNTGEGYGAGGIAGLKYNEEWIGYESTTVGMAANVLNRLNTQNGIQPTDPNILGAREPFRVGRFLVKWTKAPPFFPDMAVMFLKMIFEDMVKEVSGVPENSIGKIDVQNGAVRATSSFPAMYQETGNTVTLKVTEVAGSPVRKFLDYWISGMSDRKTGVCHMYGRRMRGILSNMAGSLLYVLLGPTCRPEDIEFACMWHEVWPSQEKTSHLNSGALGEAGSGVEMDVEFSGIYDRGPEIDILGRKFVEGYALYGQSFLNQYIPSYLYDPELFDSDSWVKGNSINIDDRLEGIKEDAIALGLPADQVIFNDEITEIRETQFHAGKENLKIQLKSSAKSLKEMGLVSKQGFVESIEVIDK